MSSAVTEPLRPPPPSRGGGEDRPRRKHRLLKILIVLVIVVAIVIAAVQAFLWSDYPRQIAIDVAQNVTGLRVEIARLDIGWSGRTSVFGLRVSLPLDDKPVLQAARVDARHTPLIGIALTQNLTINALLVRNPVVNVRQAADGSWNLQQVIRQLRTPGKNASAGGPATLPDVDVVNGVAYVSTNDGKQVECHDLALTGRRDGSLVWKLTDAHAADWVKADGEISAVGRWPHKLNIVVRPALFNAIAPLTGNLGVVAAASLQWQGERTDTGVTGRLTIPDKTTQLGPAVASGAARVTLDGDTLTVVPEGLTVDPVVAPPVTLAGGSATLRGTTLTLANLRTRFADGSARVSGSAELDPDKLRGAFEASWEQIAFPAGVVHQGRATFEVANVWPRRPWVRGEVFTSGTVAGGKFEAQAAIHGDGPAWTDATYVVDLPIARYGKKSELKLADLQATFHNTADAVELTGVRVRQSAEGNAKLDARGVYAFAGPDAGTGQFTAVGSGFAFGGQPGLSFNVNAWADHKTVTLQNAYADLGTQAWANLAGQYVLSEPEPIRMRLDFDTDPALSLRVADAVAVAGHATGTLKIGGTLAPPLITVDGTMASRGLRLNGLLIGDADLVVRGTLDKDRADLTTDHLTAFGGEGWFGADFVYFGDTVQAWTGFSGIDVAQIGAAVGTDKLSGTAAGRFDLFVPMDDPRRLSGDGRIDVADPAAPAVEAELLAIPVQIGAGYVDARPAARQARGGRADVRALVSLNQPTKFKLNVDLKNWLTQLPVAEFSALTSGSIELPQVDIAARAVSGRIEMSHRLFAHTQPIGDTHVVLHADGRRVRLETVDGHVLDGEVYGLGSVDFNDLAAGELWAGIKGLSLDRLARLEPRLQGMAGGLSASLHTHAAIVADPLGPVQADVGVQSDRATFKGIEIGDSRLRVFADRTRIALADDPHDPNYVHLAGGKAWVWGRLSRVPPGADGVSRESVFGSVHLDGLDTEQLNQMIDPDGKPVPGRLGGDVSIFGNPTSVRRLSGQGRLSLTKSDLGNIGPLAALYNAMRLGFGTSQPSGEGTVAFRLNAGRVDVTGLDYFNRGVYARGALTIDDALDVKDSHLSGYLLGTYRPLKDLSLPFFGTLDGILDALQSSATTIRVDGTMQKPNPVPASLKEVGGDFKKIIAGEAQAK